MSHRYKVGDILKVRPGKDLFFRNHPKSLVESIEITAAISVNKMTTLYGIRFTLYDKTTGTRPIFEDGIDNTFYLSNNTVLTKQFFNNDNLEYQCNHEFTPYFGLSSLPQYEYCKKCDVRK